MTFVPRYRGSCLRQTKGSIHNTKGLSSFSACSTQLCACHLPNPIVTPETHTQLYTENKRDQRNAPFPELPTSFCKVSVGDLWQNLLASENTHKLCPLLFKEQAEAQQLKQFLFLLTSGCCRAWGSCVSHKPCFSSL